MREGEREGEGERERERKKERERVGGGRTFWLLKELKCHELKKKGDERGEELR